MMIRIHKSAEVPISLRGLLPPRNDKEIDSRLCSCKDVKSALMADQHGKCAYCESRIVGDFGHIEHFRPKHGYTTAREPHMHRPGYHWLAYEWDNLLLSCSACNSACKRNRFDLRDEKGRNIKGRDTSREEPLLVNPVTEDPGEHIVFHKYMACPRMVGGKPSDKGAYTIELLRLNSREELVENRKRAWLRHESLERVSELSEKALVQRPDDKTLRAIRRTARKELERMSAPQAEYSAMFSQGRESLT